MDTTFSALLSDWRQGHKPALNQLMELVHEELRRLANHHMQRERPDHTLQATALVNEAFIRLAGAEVDWTNKKHFMVMASTMMRRVLVDHAKSKNAAKRRANLETMTLENIAPENMVANDAVELEDILMVDKLLSKLADFDERASRIVELSLFGGLSYEEIADVELVSLSTVEREMRVAKAWINQQR